MMKKHGAIFAQNTVLTVIVSNFDEKMQESKIKSAKI